MRYKRKIVDKRLLSSCESLRGESKMSSQGKTSLGSCDSDEKKYELVPPEGGWGYVVCVGLSVIFVSNFF